MPLFGELFLSEILGNPVLDPAGEEIGALRDVVIVRGNPLPKVDSLLVERRKKVVRVPWSQLSLFNKRIISSSIRRDLLAEYDNPPGDLLARRDIFDKQIVDANGAKVVRANDIKLEGWQSDAVLVAVDVGVRGIMRRLGFERRGEDILGVFGAEMPHNLISWTYIQPLQPKLSTIALTVPRQMVAELHPADLADIISQVSHMEGAELIQHLDAETAADAISELEPQAQTAMLSGLDADVAADIIEEMPPDSAADVLNNLPDEKAREILENIEQEEAEDIQELLGHESDTAGGLMTNDYVSVLAELTVAEFLRRFRTDAGEIDNVYYVYVLDSDEKLMGVTSLREVLLADPQATLGSIMEINIKSVTPEEDQMEVAAVVAKYNLLCLPVVDGEGHMLGIVTIDDIISRLLPKPSRKRRGI